MARSIFQKPKQLGLKEVGIVDHLYRFKTKEYFEKNMLLDEDESIGNLQAYG